MKNSANQFIILFLALIVIGTSIAFYQYSELGLSLDPHKENSVWKLNIKFSLNGDEGEPIKAKFYIPNLPKNEMLDQNITAKGFGRVVSQEGNNSIATISKGSADSEQTILYNLIIASNSETQKLQPPNIEIKIKSLDAKYSKVEGSTIKDVLDYVEKTSADDSSFIRQTILQTPNNKDIPLKNLLGAQNSANPIISLESDVITKRGIPNLILHVMPYKRATSLSPSHLHTWIAAYIDDKWEYFNSKTSELIDPSSALILWIGDSSLVKVDGGKASISGFTMSQQSIPQEQFQTFKNNSAKNKLYEFSLQSLPAQTQETYKIIIMIPLGVLIILILRIIIGIPTLGTFMPVLIALAFRDTSLIWGIIFFVLVVVIGLSFRKYFETLKLLTVPRLGMLLTVVVLILACITVITNKLELQTGLSITLFPMVILTMSIERIAILWEERGPSEALITSTGSLFASSIIYLFIFNDTLEYILFTFPSLLLIIMALMLLIGKYRGYRLSELIRFKSLINKDK